MSERIIIPGPPGTGKTHRLIHYLNKELNEYKTDPVKIAFISFSKAAAEEAKRRINNDKIFAGTMHSLGARSLSIDTNSQLLKGSKWKTFKNFSVICQHLSFESYVTETGIPQYKNHHMKIIEYARSKKLTLNDAAIELGLQYSVDIWFTEQLAEDLKAYKEQENMFEFSDMITKFIEQDKCPPLDVVFLDEAQDLSPLQWDMFFYIEEQCKRSYIAGDDDQTIYNFQGANPEIFINLKGTFDPQIKSRRVPRKIHQLAESIFPHMTERLDKKWEPRDAEGEIENNVSLEDLDFTTGQWMILARTNEKLKPIAEHLTRQTIRFTSKIQNLLSKELLNAYRTWIRLNAGALVSKEDAQDLYKFLNYKKGHVEYGFSGGKSLNTVENVDLDTLRLEHGLRVAGDWEQLHIPEESKNYMKALIDSGDDLMKEPRIKVSTIHGVKGEECDNVVLHTDLEKIIYDAALKNADPEHRTFFVGVTRTKEKLFLVRPTSEYNYTIGDPIV